MVQAKPKIKEVLERAAREAGDDQMSLYEPQDYLTWLGDACLWLAKVTAPELWKDMIEEDTAVSLAADSADAILPTDCARVLSVKRDDKVCDIIDDPIAFRELYSTTSQYFKTSDDSPAVSFMDGKMKVSPVGKTGDSTMAIIYLETIGDDEDADFPMSILLVPAAVSYVAGRAISQESDEEGIRSGSLKLEEAGLLSAGS